jgi:hypothetical protein
VEEKNAGIPFLASGSRSNGTTLSRLFVCVLGSGTVCNRVAVCETCRILFNSLEDANARFVRAISNVRTLTGRGVQDGFQVALREAECLRIEYEDIQTALERHRAEHHSRASPRQDPSTG